MQCKPVPCICRNGGVDSPAEISSTKARSQEEDLAVYDTSQIKDTDVKYQVEGGFIYFDKEKGEITGCDKEVTSGVIPAEIYGVKVTAIGSGAFMSCSELTSITGLAYIASGIAKIGLLLKLL